MAAQDYELLPLYEGNDDYIFISYSHKDMDDIYPVIEWLIDHNYRVWYDQGIHPGTDWPEVVAGRLNDCAVFLVFLSENYMQSQNCIRELHFAVSKRKQFLTILLEDVKMTPGVEMQIGISQAIRKHGYKEKQFYQALASADALPRCKFPEPEPEPEPVPVQAAPAQTAPVQTAPVQTAAPPVKQPPKREKPAKSSTGEPVWKKFLIPGIAAVAVIAIVAILIGVFAGGDKPGHSGGEDDEPEVTGITIAGANFPTDSSTLRLENLTLTAADVTALQQFSNMTTLYCTDCTFEDAAAKEFSGLAGVYTLRMQNCTGVTDYGFVTGMTKLSILELENMDVADGAFPADWSSEKLDSLSITNSPKLTDVSFLANLPKMKYLTLKGCGLTEVDAAISGMKDLIKLDLSGNQLTAVSEPLKCLRLTLLDLSDNHITDLSGVTNLTVLDTFRFANNDYFAEKDWGLTAMNEDPLLFLNKNTETLKVVDLSYNSMGHSMLYMLLHDCEKLTDVRISGNPQPSANLEIFENAAELKHLEAADCQLGYAYGLQKITTLEYVDLSNNDIFSLRDFPVMAGSYARLILNSNSLDTLSDLPAASFSYLLAFDNPLWDVEVAEGLKATYLGVTWFDGLTGDMMAGGTHYYVTGVPADQQVAFDKACFVTFGTIDVDGNEVLDE